jgi:hypothetical protein
VVLLKGVAPYLVGDKGVTKIPQFGFKSRRPDEQQWRIIQFTFNDLLKYKKSVRERRICA